MLEAIVRIETRAAGDRQAFVSSDLIQVWVIHHLQILGEAASRISEPLRLAYPEIPWPRIIGMRHVLVHGYFHTDLDIVWRAVEHDLPLLKSQVVAVLARLVSSDVPEQHGQ